MISQIVIGQYGMTPELMEKAGIIKPGSAPLINALVNKGVSLKKAMPPILFTGVQGAKNLSSFANNVKAQSFALRKNLKKAETDLKNAGVITGKENIASVGGVIKAAATVGLVPTLGVIKSSSGTLMGLGAGSSTGMNPSAALGLTSKLTSAAAGAAGKALGAIGSGNLAGKLADGVTSGLGGLKSSLDGIAKSQGLTSIADQAKGMAAGAFNAIKDSFPTLPAGVPVNVLAEAKKSAEKAAEAALSKLGSASGAAGALKGGGSALKGALDKAAGGLKNQLSGAVGKAVSGAASSIGGALSGKAGGLTGALSSATSGGGAAGAGALLNKAGDALKGAAGTLATTATTAAAQSINALGASATNAVGAFGGKAADAVGAAKGAVSGLAQTGASALASGISNLPGGAGAAGALKNLKTGGNPLKGALGGLTKGLKDQATNLVNNLKPPALDAAAALAKSGLPAGLAAQLETQISSMGSGGGAPVKMASIAVNTTDRSEITASISATLGDPGIPPPNFTGEVSEVTAGQVDDARKAREAAVGESNAAFEAFLQADKKRIMLMAERDKAKQTLPQGDPAIAAAEAALQSFRPEWDSLRQKAIKASEVAAAKATAASDLADQKAAQDKNKPQTA